MAEGCGAPTASRRFQLLDLGFQGVDVRKGLGFGFTAHGLLRFNRVCLSAFLADVGGVLGFPHGAEQVFQGFEREVQGLFQLLRLVLTMHNDSKTIICHYSFMR